MTGNSTDEESAIHRADPSGRSIREIPYPDLVFVRVFEDGARFGDAGAGQCDQFIQLAPPFL